VVDTSRETGRRQAVGEGYGSAGYRGYVLVVLALAYTLNFVDRSIIGIVQEPLKHEFGLTDLQLGLLGGPTFAVLYTVLGVPIARTAERRDRITILSICIGLWSAMTAVCGLATGFGFLLLARVGVSIGEAGCTPPAQSVISDYFPAKRRATALAVYSLGIPLGIMIASLAGGYVAQNFGWRRAFLLLGLPASSWLSSPKSQLGSLRARGPKAHPVSGGPGAAVEQEDLSPRRRGKFGGPVRHLRDDPVPQLIHDP